MDITELLNSTEYELGPHKVKVERVDLSNDDYVGESSTTDHEQLINYIADDLGPEVELDTRLHEILETINTVADLEMNHTQIQTLALLLTQALLSS